MQLVEAPNQRRACESKRKRGSYNPASNICRDDPRVPDKNRIQRPPDRKILPMTGFETSIAFLNRATSQFLKSQCLPRCCSCTVKDSHSHGWSISWTSFLNLQEGIFMGDLWWAILHRWNCRVFLMHPRPPWVLDLLQIWSPPLR